MVCIVKVEHTLLPVIGTVEYCNLQEGSIEIAKAPAEKKKHIHLISGERHTRKERGNKEKYGGGRNIQISLDDPG